MRLVSLSFVLLLVLFSTTLVESKPSLIENQAGWKQHSAKSPFSFGFKPKGMTSGNILLTQPNEVETGNLLVEMTQKGELVNDYNLGGAKVRAVDMRFFQNQLFLLGVLENPGVFLASPDLQSFKVLGQADSNLLPCPWALAFDFSSSSSSPYLHVLSVNNASCNSMPRAAKIDKFDLNGKHLGTLITGGELESPNGIAIDSQGQIWTTCRTGIKMFSQDGKLQKTITSDLAPQIYSSLKFSPTSPSLLYVSLILPDYVIAVDTTTGETKKKFKMLQTANREKEGERMNSTTTYSGAPAGMCWDPSGKTLFVENSDSMLTNTPRVQVFDDVSQQYITGLGGTQCGNSPPNFLCQAFNGLELIP